MSHQNYIDYLNSIKTGNLSKINDNVALISGVGDAITSLQNQITSYQNNITSLETDNTNLAVDNDKIDAIIVILSEL